MAPLLVSSSPPSTIISDTDSATSSSQDGGKENNTNSGASVRFVSFLQHRIIPPSGDYSMAEVQASWYSRAELSMIKKERYATVTLLNQGKTFALKSQQYCADGLLTDDETCLRSTTISEALDAVLSEQETQLEEESGIDHDMIADVYFEACCFSESQAWDRGMRVSREVRELNADYFQASAAAAGIAPPETSPKVAQSKSFGRTRAKRTTNPSKSRSLPKGWNNQARPTIYRPPRITHTIHTI